MYNAWQTHVSSFVVYNLVDNINVFRATKDQCFVKLFYSANNPACWILYLTVSLLDHPRNNTV